MAPALPRILRNRSLHLLGQDYLGQVNVGAERASLSGPTDECRAANRARKFFSGDQPFCQRSYTPHTNSRTCIEGYSTRNPLEDLPASTHDLGET